MTTASLRHLAPALTIRPLLTGCKLDLRELVDTFEADLFEAGLKKRFEGHDDW